MNSLYLIGGGWLAEGLSATFGHFIKAASVKKYCNILLVMEAETTQDQNEYLQKYSQVFQSLGVTTNELTPFFISNDCYLTLEYLMTTQPSGIFICGGLTPVYQQFLCSDIQWLDYIFTQNIPYAGFSAGAAIAAKQAIIGGWKIRLGEKDIPILDSDLAEGLEFLKITNGLDLFPFSIDVHASQWGTVTRLIHAVDQGMVTEGWAIDENTMLHVENNKIHIIGMGQAYYVRHIQNNKIQIDIYRDGSSSELSI